MANDPVNWVDLEGQSGIAVGWETAPTIGGVTAGVSAGAISIGVGIGLAIWPTPAGEGSDVVPPIMESNFPPGYCPGDKGAAEWGKRNGGNPKAGKNKFHKLKQNCPGSKPTDVFGTNPATGDVIGPDGESVGNLGDEN